MRELEHQHAVAFVNWWAYQANLRKLDPRLLFAIPNGGARSVRTGARLKKEGVRRGVPDYFLAIANGGFSGLFVELKTETGRASDDQIEMANLFRSQGFKVVVAKGTSEAMEAVVEYLRPPIPWSPHPPGVR